MAVQAQAAGTNNSGTQGFLASAHGSGAQSRAPAPAETAALSRGHLSYRVAAADHNAPALGKGFAAGQDAGFAAQGLEMGTSQPQMGGPLGATLAARR